MTSSQLTYLAGNEHFNHLRRAAAAEALAKSTRPQRAVPERTVRVSTGFLRRRHSIKAA
jgi:hypothetical protein